MIRRATLDDIDDLLDIGVAVYPEFDAGASRAWLAQAMKAPWMAVWRGDVSGGVCSVSAPFYRPTEIRSFMVFIGATDPKRAEGVRLARAMILWARTMGATTFRFGSQTECDLGPLAKRLGAKEESPSYCLEI